MEPAAAREQVRSLARRQPAADFEAYVHARSAWLSRLSLALAPSPHDAEDLLQATLMRLFLKWRRASRADNVDAYVRRVMTNEFLATRRKRSASELPQMVEIEVVARDTAIQSVDDRQDLQVLLRDLSHRERAALALRFYEDLPFANVADLLGVKEATARSLVSRAIAKIRKSNPGAIGD